MSASKAELVKTSVMKQREGSVSLKTTIPETYAVLLKLKSGDKLEWDHELINNEIIIKIRKVRK